MIGSEFKYFNFNLQWHRCHDRTASDCCFLSSTSVLATTGLSATNRNIAIWDTLLPPRSMLVKGINISNISHKQQQLQNVIIWHTVIGSL